MTAMKETMGVKKYCDTVSTELTGLKAKVFDMMCAVEKMPEDRKARLKPQYSDFFELVDFIDEKLKILTKECPAEWSPIREEIEGKKKELTEKINVWDAEHIAGGYVGG